MAAVAFFGQSDYTYYTDSSMPDNYVDQSSQNTDVYDPNYQPSFDFGDYSSQDSLDVTNPLSPYYDPSVVPDQGYTSPSTDVNNPYGLTDDSTWNIPQTSSILQSVGDFFTNLFASTGAKVATDIVNNAGKTVTQQLSSLFQPSAGTNVITAPAGKTGNSTVDNSKSKSKTSSGTPFGIPAWLPIVGLGALMLL